MLGFAASAKLVGRRVSVGVPSPGVISTNYRFLPTELLDSELTAENPPQTLLAFDCGSADRLGSLAHLVDEVESLVVVDHHVSNTGFGTLNVIDPEAAATTELVLGLLQELEWPVDEVVATCLLVGLTTDSGRFQYSSTSARTHRVAAELIEAGARPEMIGQAIFEEEPFDLLGVAGAVLSRAQLDVDRKLVWSSLFGEDLRESSLDVEETELLIDLVRLPREADVAMLAREAENGKIRVSLRSRGRVDVGEIASSLGGGGHRNAGGFISDLDISSVVTAVKERLPLVPSA